jgi:hypothetical protein
VRRLARRPLHGRVPVAFLGFRRRIAIGPTDLFGILEDGDFDPWFAPTRWRRCAGP